MLAYYHYPFVENRNYIEYTEEDLMKPEVVRFWKRPSPKNAGHF